MVNALIWVDDNGGVEWEGYPYMSGVSVSVGRTFRGDHFCTSDFDPASQYGESCFAR